MTAVVQDESYWCEEVFQKFEYAVVRMDEGSGFIVHAEAGGKMLLILTCKHVVGEVPVGGTLAAYFSGSINPSFNATVVHVDKARDLALLRARDVVAPAGPVTPLRFFDPETGSGWTNGWNVVALSFIDMADGALILAPGTFSGQITNEPDNAVDVCLRCSCSSKPGASGSPIILAGVNQVVAVLAGCSLASVDGIPVRVVKDFFREWLGGGTNISANGLVSLAARRQ